MARQATCLGSSTQPCSGRAARVSGEFGLGKNPDVQHGYTHACRAHTCMLKFFWPELFRKEDERGCGGRPWAGQWSRAPHPAPASPAPLEASPEPRSRGRGGVSEAKPLSLAVLGCFPPKGS